MDLLDVAIFEAGRCGGVTTRVLLTGQQAVEPQPVAQENLDQLVLM